MIPSKKKIYCPIRPATAVPSPYIRLQTRSTPFLISTLTASRDSRVTHPTSCCSNSSATYSRPSGLASLTPYVHLAASQASSLACPLILSYAPSCPRNRPELKRFSVAAFLCPPRTSDKYWTPTLCEAKNRRTNEPSKGYFGGREDGHGPLPGCPLERPSRPLCAPGPRPPSRMRAPEPGSEGLSPYEPASSSRPVAGGRRRETRATGVRPTSCKLSPPQAPADPTARPPPRAHAPPHSASGSANGLTAGTWGAARQNA